MKQELKLGKTGGEDGLQYNSIQTHRENESEELYTGDRYR